MLSIAQLRYILAVHQYAHFGKAAKACGVSQPTLSGQIQKAEEDLGITIFDRQQKPVGSTEKGLKLIKQAETVVAAHERLLRLAQGQFETIAGELSVGIIPTLAPYVMPWFLKNFAETYPQVSLAIVERTTADIVQGLEQRHIDVGIAAIPLAMSGLQERVLFHDPFYLYAEASESILDDDEIDATALDPKKLWLLEDGHCVRNQTIALCDIIEGCSHLSTVRFEAASFETLQYLIDASEGYTLVPETYARLLPTERRQRQIRPFGEPTPTRQVGLIHPKASWKLEMIEALEATIRASIPRSLRQKPAELEVLPVTGARASAKTDG